MISILSKRPGATITGIFSLALSSVLLLCGAGSVPVNNLLPQGTMQGDLNAGGHGITNLATNSIMNSALQTNVTTQGNVFNGPGLLGQFDATGNASSGNYGIPQGPVPASTTKVVCYGDSITAGNGAPGNYSWPNQLANMGFGNGMTVYNLGAVGQTAVYGAANYSTSLAYANVPNPGTYSPHSLAGSGYYFLDEWGTNDADAISAGINSVVTTCTTNGTTTVTNVGSITNIEIGGYMRCTDVPSTATVVSKSTASGGTVVISTAATGSHSGLAIQFATETLADYEAAEQSIWTSARTDGYRIARMSLTPRAISTDTALTQTVRTQINTWLATQHYTGSGSGWDQYVDIASALTNASDANLFSTTSPAGIHPTAQGYQIYAAMVNAKLISAYGSDFSIYPFTTNGLLNKWLPADVSYLDVAQTWTSQQAWTKSTSSPSIQVNTAASTGGDSLTLNGVASGTSNGQLGFAIAGNDQWQLLTAGAAGSAAFQIKDVIGGVTPFSIAEGTGVVSVGSLVTSATGTITAAGGGNGSISLNGGTQVIALNNQLGGGTSITGSSGGTLHWTQQFNNSTLQFTDNINSVNQLTISPGSGTTGGIGVAGALSVSGTSALNGATTVTSSSSFPLTIAGTSAVVTGLAMTNTHASTQIAIQFQQTGTEKWDFGMDSAGNGTLDFFIYQAATGHLSLQIKTNDDVYLNGGNLMVDTVGKGLQIKEGSNAKQGTVTLSAGTVTVSNTSVTANSRIFLTVTSLGTVTTPKAVAVTGRTAGTSFTITSADNTDTSTVAYEIFEPAP